MKDQNTLTIRSDASTAMAMVQTDYTPVREKTSQVIFRKYGDRYFLEEVLVSNRKTRAGVSLRELLLSFVLQGPAVTYQH